MELLLPLLFILPLLWLFSRQRKQQQSQSRLQNDLQPGQEVMTTAGLFGTVVRVEGDTMVIEVSPGVEMRFLTAALARIVPDAGPTTAVVDEVEVAQDGLADPDGTVDLRKQENNSRREA